MPSKPFIACTSSAMDSAMCSRPVEIVNLRLRMIAAGEPYAPTHREPSAGRWQRRLLCGAGGVLRWQILANAPLPAGRTGARRCDPWAGDDYRIHLGDGAAAGLLRARWMASAISSLRSQRRSAHDSSHAADPVELAIFQSAVHSIAEEMGAALRRTALSPNIKERRDYSCAIFDGQARVIAMGDHMPVHLGSMPMSVQAAIAAIAFAPGDIAILNDPYAGGTHLPDITMVLPVFLPGRDQPAFYVSNRAHHADVGGAFAGSMGPATEIFQEGIRIPPVRIVRGGKVDREMLDLILLNVRTPKEREGDLESQIGACRVGEQRMLQLAEKYGERKLQALIEELLDYSERLVRAELRKMPAGDFTAEDWLDDDGVTEAPAEDLRAPALRSGGSVRACGFCRLFRAGCGQRERGPRHYALSVLLCAALPARRGCAGDRGHSAAADAGYPSGEHCRCVAARAGRRGQRGNLAAHCGCAAAGAGAGDSGARSGGERRHDEQSDDWRH